MLLSLFYLHKATTTQVAVDKSHNRKKIRKTNGLQTKIQAHKVLVSTGTMLNNFARQLDASQLFIFRAQLLHTLAAREISTGLWIKFRRASRGKTASARPLKKGSGRRSAPVWTPREARDLGAVEPPTGPGCALRSLREPWG